MKRSLLEIQNQVIEIVKSIKVLDKISWPSHVEKLFFDEYKNGNKPILKFDYPKINMSEEILKLRSIKDELSMFEPSHIYIAQTIDSYINAMEMMGAAGTIKFQELSILEYGTPHHKLFGSKFSHLDTAKNFLKVYQQFDHPYIHAENEVFSAKELKRFLVKESHELLGEHSPKISLTSKIVSKAAAGKTRVRIRSNAEFSKYDFNQLLIHEIMTHSLTAINGSLQTQFPLLAQGSPRTTKTQEGLATFSEVITGSIDLARLKRISLRLLAIDMSLRGADFYDLFEFFKNNDQDEKESYLSASRILRGGTAAGGITFTKDGVYLEGLIRVHSFFRWAFRSNNLDLAHLLFCGRIDINDIFLLKNEFHLGNIEMPKYLPNWYQDIDQLAGKMAFSLMLNGIDIESVDRHYSSKLLKIKAA